MSKRFGVDDNRGWRQYIDSAALIFILGLAFSSGILYAQFFDLKDEVARIEQHLNSVDYYAHRGRQVP